MTVLGRRAVTRSSRITRRYAKEETPRYFDPNKLMLFEKYWKSFLLKLINQMYITRTTGAIHEEALESIKKGLIDTLDIFKNSIPVAKFEMYKQQYETVKEALKLLNLYNPKFRERLTDLIITLEGYKNIKHD